MLLYDTIFLTLSTYLYTVLSLQVFLIINLINMVFSNPVCRKTLVSDKLAWTNNVDRDHLAEHSILIKIHAYYSKICNLRT